MHRNLTTRQGEYNLLLLIYTKKTNINLCGYQAHLDDSMIFLGSIGLYNKLDTILASQIRNNVLSEII